MTISRIDIDKLARLAPTHTVKELADALDIVPSYARSLLRKHGIKCKKYEPVVGKRKPNTEKLLRIAAEGIHTAPELASKFGVDRSWVNRVCRESGIVLPVRIDPYKNLRNEFGEVMTDMPHDQEPEVFPEPTSAYPGSFEKIQVLADRVRRGEHLWHPDDQSDFSGARWYMRLHVAS